MVRWRRAAALTLAALAGAVATACSAATEAAEGDIRPADGATLVVAADLPAPGFWEGGAAGALDGGLEYGLAQELAARSGLGLRVVDIAFTDIVHGRLGDADLALAQVSITDGRAADVDFSVPYFDSAPTVLARSEEELTDLATARDRRWAVREGTTQAGFVDEVIEPTSATLFVADEAAAATAVLDGRADMALLDLSTALVLAKDVPGLAAIARFDTEERYGAVLPDGSRNLEAVDTALRAMDADGTLAGLVTRWLEPRYAVDPAALAVITAR